MHMVLGNEIGDETQMRKKVSKRQNQGTDGDGSTSDDKYHYIYASEWNFQPVVDVDNKMNYRQCQNYMWVAGYVL